MKVEHFYKHITSALRCGVQNTVLSNYGRALRHTNTLLTQVGSREPPAKNGASRHRRAPGNCQQCRYKKRTQEFTPITYHIILPVCTNSKYSITDQRSSDARPADSSFEPPADSEF